MYTLEKIVHYLLSIGYFVCMANGTTNLHSNNWSHEHNNSFAHPFAKSHHESNSVNSHALKDDVPRLKKHECANGYGYKSLRECKEVCDFDGDGNIVEMENSDAPTSYKLLTLKTNEYVVKDGKLSAGRLDIQTSQFILRNSTAFICYEFPSTFVKCMHRCVDEDGMNLTKSNTRLYVADYKLWYSFHEFYLMKDPKLCTGAAICISNLTLIFQKLEDIHLILNSLSAACLWVTLGLCAVLPEMRVVVNRPLLYHLALLAIGYTIICWKSVAMMYFPDFLTDLWCISLSSIQQFSLLSALFWMNVQSYELYSLLRQPFWPDLLSCFDKRRWLFHWFYGWLLPSLITALALAAEVLAPLSNRLTPGFADECWFDFKKKTTLFIWYYGWMAISLLINMVLLVFITKSLQKWSKDIEKVNDGSVSQTYIVLFKLIFIMGFCWLLNLLRWSLTSRGYVYYALDIIRALQGCYILIAYVARRRICMSIISRCMELTPKQKKKAGLYEYDL